MQRIYSISRGFIFMVLLQLAGFTGNTFAQQSITASNEIRSFQASFIPDRGMQLSWSTKYNDTTAFTVIERSIDGFEFKKIGELSANNTRTEYRFIDRTPIKDVSYYRLQVFDYDGNSYTSPLISTYIPTYGKPELVLYPMPVGNAQTLNLNFQGVEQSFEARISITDQTGRQVLTKELTINTMQAHTQLELEGKLSAGTYQITVLGHNGQNFRIGKLLQIVN